MSARDGASSVRDKYGNEICRTCEAHYPSAGDGWDGECPTCADIRANDDAGGPDAGGPPAGFWATIPSFGQEVRAVAVIFAIAGLVMLVARS